MGIFTIELSSDHAEWNRFNVRLMCELQDAAGRRTGFASTSERVHGRSVLRAESCERVRAFIYAIPESLPVDRTVGRQPDFAAVLRASFDGRTVAEERIAINRWGGTSLERIYDRTGIKHE